LNKYTEIEFINIDENKAFKELIEKVVNKCFEEENLQNINMYLNIILTNPEYIREANKKYRNIDKETDVLSFPMFQKDELDDIVSNSKQSQIEIQEVLGDIIISIPRVQEQAEEYGHSVERELSYMVVHGFYHIIGYDHIEEDDKIKMRAKEEVILNKLNITREKGE
jgi:probable rRNA maturation factor